MIQSTTQNVQIFGDSFIKFYDIVFDFQNQRMGFNPKFTPPTFSGNGWAYFLA